MKTKEEINELTERLKSMSVSMGRVRQDELSRVFAAGALMLIWATEEMTDVERAGFDALMLFEEPLNSVASVLSSHKRN